MLIPSKFSGYRAGIRLYPGGGGGGPVEQVSTPAAPPPPPPPPWANLGVNTQQGYNTLMGLQMPNASPAAKGMSYNSLLSQGFDDAAIRSSADALFSNPASVDWNSVVQQGAMQSPTGRPMAGSGQFYQPIYQPQYYDYNMGNPMSVSQYGQGMGGYNPYQMSTPFNPYTNSFQTPFSFGGGYGGYGGGFGNANAGLGMIAPRVSSGPMAPIVSRSASMRGTPNVMRRASGGIADLID